MDFQTNSAPFGGLNNRRTLLSIENLISAIEAVLMAWDIGLHSGINVVGDDDVVSTCEIVSAIKQGMNGRAYLLAFPNFLLSFALNLFGREKLVMQLTSDLEVDSKEFQSVFDWQPKGNTQDSLRELSSHFNS